MTRSFSTALATLCLITSSAQADQVPDILACLNDQADKRAPAGACIQDQIAYCNSYPADEALAAAMLCFRDAQAAWSTALSGQLDDLRATSDDTTAALTGIEVKYDLLSGLMQCDRLEELAVVTDQPADHIALQKARCQTAATGLSLSRLTISLRGRE